MILSGLFVFLLAITVGLTVIQLLGYQVLNSLIIMIVVDFMALGAYIQTNRRESNPVKTDNPHGLVPRIEGIEKTCSQILEHVNTVSIKENMQKNKDDMTYILEKIARRTMDLEQKLDNFGQIMAKSMLDISGRIKGIENGEPIEQIEDVTNTEPEKQGISVGEIIYVDEDTNQQ